MALELNMPNLEYLNEVLKMRNMTARQLSKVIYGEQTHRDIIKEVTKKPDVRASTVVKLCRALDISMDSLYQNSDSDSLKSQTINGIGIVNNSPNAKIDMADLRAENKALKMLIEEKNKRIEEQKRYIEQLHKSLDMALQVGHKSDTDK